MNGFFEQAGRLNDQTHQECLMEAQSQEKTIPATRRNPDSGNLMIQLP